MKDAKTRLILSNIIRSSYEEPLEWSQVSQVSGTASISGTLSGKIPIIGHQAGGSLFYEIDPSVTASGGPTFTVPLLDTKEFQSGIQTPITPRLLKTFVDEGYPLDLLLSLLVSEITIGTGDRTYRIMSHQLDQTASLQSTSDATADGLTSVLHLLVRQGLAIEPQGKAVGPVFAEKDVKDLKTVTDAIGAGVTIQQYDLTKNVDPFLTDADRSRLKELKATIYVRAVDPTVYRFCFDPSGLDLSSPRLSQDTLQKFLIPVPSPAARKVYLFAGKDSGGSENSAVQIARHFNCGYRGHADDENSTLTLQLRSVEGAVRYLGSLVRAEVGIGSTARVAPLHLVADQGEKKGPAGPVLFNVTRGEAPTSPMAVRHCSSYYSVDPDNYPADQSVKVLSFLLEAINLNSSSKDLPSPSVVSIISH